ncbi:hypothetical protein N2152v2_008230 [Parachlorella kessleri]
MEKECLPESGRLRVETGAGASVPVVLNRTLQRHIDKRAEKGSTRLFSDSEVVVEWRRCQNLSCAVCGELGASAVCYVCSLDPSVGDACFHFPCARKAAQGGWQGGTVVFHETRRQLACPTHADSVAKPIREPQGDWFEGFGGWNGGVQEAEESWKRSHPRQHQQLSFQQMAQQQEQPTHLASHVAQGQQQQQPSSHDPPEEPQQRQPMERPNKAEVASHGADALDLTPTPPKEQQPKPCQEMHKQEGQQGDSTAAKPAQSTQGPAHSEPQQVGPDSRVPLQPAVALVQQPRKLSLLDRMNRPKPSRRVLRGAPTPVATPVMVAPAAAASGSVGEQPRCGDSGVSPPAAQPQAAAGAGAVGHSGPQSGAAAPPSGPSCERAGAQGSAQESGGTGLDQQVADRQQQHSMSGMGEPQQPEHPGASTGMGEPQLLQQQQQPVVQLQCPEAPLGAPGEAGWDIPGYYWVASGFVRNSPPLRPGEARVLGHTIAASLVPKRLEVLKLYKESMASVKGSYPAVKVIGQKDPDRAPYERAIRESIAQHCENGKLNLDELPEELPVLPGCEMCPILPDDPRVGLAKEPGAKGWRNATGRTVKRFTVLGAYQCLQLINGDFEDMAFDQQLQAKLNQGMHQLQLHLNSYAADSTVHAGNSRAQQLVTKVLDLTDIRQLVYSAYCYGNETALINDIKRDPLTELRLKTVSKLSDAPGLSRNCSMVEALVGGWPFLFLVTCVDVANGQEFLTTYEDFYWKEVVKCLRSQAASMGQQLQSSQPQPSGLSGQAVQPQPTNLVTQASGVQAPAGAAAAAAAAGEVGTAGAAEQQQQQPEGSTSKAGTAGKPPAGKRSRKKSRLVRDSSGPLQEPPGAAATPTPPAAAAAGTGASGGGSPCAARPYQPQQQQQQLVVELELEEQRSPTPASNAVPAPVVGEPRKLPTSPFVGLAAAEAAGAGGWQAGKRPAGDAPPTAGSLPVLDEVFSSPAADELLSPVKPDPEQLEQQGGPLGPVTSLKKPSPILIPRKASVLPSPDEPRRQQQEQWEGDVKSPKPAACTVGRSGGQHRGRSSSGVGAKGRLEERPSSRHVDSSRAKHRREEKDDEQRQKLRRRSSRSRSRSRSPGRGRRGHSGGRAADQPAAECRGSAGALRSPIGRQQQPSPKERAGSAGGLRSPAGKQQQPRSPGQKPSPGNARAAGHAAPRAEKDQQQRGRKLEREERRGASRSRSRKKRLVEKRPLLVKELSWQDTFPRDKAAAAAPPAAAGAQQDRQQAQPRAAGPGEHRHAAGEASLASASTQPLSQLRRSSWGSPSVQAQQPSAPPQQQQQAPPRRSSWGSHSNQVQQPLVPPQHHQQQQLQQQASGQSQPPASHSGWPQGDLAADLPACAGAPRAPLQVSLGLPGVCTLLPPEEGGWEQASPEGSPRAGGDGATAVGVGHFGAPTHCIDQQQGLPQPHACSRMTQLATMLNQGQLPLQHPMPAAPPPQHAAQQPQQQPLPVALPQQSHQQQQQPTKPLPVAPLIPDPWGQQAQHAPPPQQQHQQQQPEPLPVSEWEMPSPPASPRGPAWPAAAAGDSTPDIEFLLPGAAAPAGGDTPDIEMAMGLDAGAGLDTGAAGGGAGGAGAVPVGDETPEVHMALAGDQGAALGGAGAVAGGAGAVDAEPAQGAGGDTPDLMDGDGYQDLLDGVPAVSLEEPPTPDLDDLDLPPVPQYLWDRWAQQHQQEPVQQAQHTVLAHGAELAPAAPTGGPVLANAGPPRQAQQEALQPCQGQAVADARQRLQIPLPPARPTSGSQLPAPALPTDPRLASRGGGAAPVLMRAASSGSGGQAVGRPLSAHASLPEGTVQQGQAARSDAAEGGKPSQQQAQQHVNGRHAAAAIGQRCKAAGGTTAPTSADTGRKGPAAPCGQVQQEQQQQQQPGGQLERNRSSLSVTYDPSHPENRTLRRRERALARAGASRQYAVAVGKPGAANDLFAASLKGLAPSRSLAAQPEESEEDEEEQEEGGEGESL